MIEPLLENLYAALPYAIFLGVSVYLVFGLSVAWSYYRFLLAEFKEEETSSQPSRAQSLIVSVIALLVAILLIPELLAGSRTGDAA